MKDNDINIRQCIRQKWLLEQMESPYNDKPFIH